MTLSEAGSGPKKQKKDKKKKKKKKKKDYLKLRCMIRTVDIYARHCSHTHTHTHGPCSVFSDIIFLTYIILGLPKIKFIFKLGYNHILVRK